MSIIRRLSGKSKNGASLSATAIKEVRAGFTQCQKKTEQITQEAVASGGEVSARTAPTAPAANVPGTRLPLWRWGALACVLAALVIGVGCQPDQSEIEGTGEVGEIEDPAVQDASSVIEEIEGPAGIPLVWVPGGSFMMGNDDGRSEQAPAHPVEVSGFWIGKTEVTVAQWRSVMGSVPLEDQQLGDDHPVANVSWDDCQEFCEKAGLEMPTEAQWEYAARGSENRIYPWGDEWDPDRLCWHENRGPEDRTFPVGSFPSGASWCGALDMSGNLWEWCADWYAEDYYASSPETDPVGPSSGEKRVARGGSWGCDENFCTTTFRDDTNPAARDANNGFRVAKNDE